MIGRMYEYELEDFKEQFHDNIKDTRKKAKETVSKLIIFLDVDDMWYRILQAKSFYSCYW